MDAQTAAAKPSWAPKDPHTIAMWIAGAIGLSICALMIGFYLPIGGTVQATGSITRVTHSMSAVDSQQYAMVDVSGHLVRAGLTAGSGCSAGDSMQLIRRHYFWGFSYVALPATCKRPG